MGLESIYSIKWSCLVLIWNSITSNFPLFYISWNKYFSCSLNNVGGHLGTVMKILCTDYVHVLDVLKCLRCKSKHWVLIVLVVMKESCKVQSDKCQWLSGVNLSFQHSNWVFFSFWLKKNQQTTSQVQIDLTVHFFRVLSVLFRAHSFFFFFLPTWRTENPKLCIKSQVAAVKSQLRYIPLYTSGCSWFVSLLFIYSL